MKSKFRQLMQIAWMDSGDLNSESLKMRTKWGLVNFQNSRQRVKKAAAEIPWNSGFLNSFRRVELVGNPIEIDVFAFWAGRNFILIYFEGLEMYCLKSPFDQMMYSGSILIKFDTSVKGTLPFFLLFSCIVHSNKQKSSCRSENTSSAVWMSSWIECRWDCSCEWKGTVWSHCEEL